MSQVDLNKYREELLKVHKEVSQPNGPIIWAVFGYEGKTNILKFIEKGDDYDEMVEELNSSKIMYAYVKVVDPNTNLPKFVLINWQGEGCPEIRKGSCASHFNDVRNFFRGAHLTINARTEDDIEQDTVRDKIAKASGCNYSFHKEKAQPLPEAGPVGSVYKRIQPAAAINLKARDQFWKMTAEEEQSRKQEEDRKLNMEKAKLEKEIRDREEMEAKNREKLESERLKKIAAMKKLEQETNEEKRNEMTMEEIQKETMRDEIERRNRSEMMRKQRQAEAQSLLAQRENDPRAVFEQKPVSQFADEEKAAATPPSRKLKYTFLPEEEHSNPAGRKPPVQLPVSSPEVEQPTADTSSSDPSPSDINKHREPSPEPAPVSPPASQPRLPNLLSEGLPPRQKSDDENEDSDAWGEDEESAPKVEPVIASPLEPSPEEDDIYENQDMTGQVSPTSDKGLCARAIYDYQAGDDTEISFDPQDIITNIDQIDSGWWTGTAPDGTHGMFPANYVELI